jgi:hypothetical protein
MNFIIERFTKVKKKPQKLHSKKRTKHKYPQASFESSWNGRKWTRIKNWQAWSWGPTLESASNLTTFNTKHGSFLQAFVILLNMIDLKH